MKVIWSSKSALALARKATKADNSPALKTARETKRMLSQISQQIKEEINRVLTHQQGAESGAKIQAAVEGVLRRLNLVTREEFDAQAAVLLRTRERLENLEAQLKALEEKDV